MRVLAALMLFLGLAACSGDPVWAPDAEVNRRVYQHNAPPSITLITVISNTSDGGAHSGLLINGSQRLMFDPAGSWKHPYAPERNDVHFGLTPPVETHYLDYHARVTFRVVTQTVEVSRAVADKAIRDVQAYGAVGPAYCTNSITDVLRGLPGFEPMPRTFFPKVAMRAFSQIPGVQTRTIRDDSPDDNRDLLDAQTAIAAATQG